jgi:hypothetical protein
MTEQGVGTPVRVDRSVQAVFTEITKCQGSFLEGEEGPAFNKAVQSIVQMVIKTGGSDGLLVGKQSSVAKLRTTVQHDNVAIVTSTAAVEAIDFEKRNKQLSEEIALLMSENEKLKAQLKEMK